MYIYIYFFYNLNRPHTPLIWNTGVLLYYIMSKIWFVFQESKKYDLLKGVRITVVDNFQGEESDIILLSLVRSNKDANIGFLKIENRVCVALSRARKGMYIMGNMENLTRSSDIWKKIKETLEHQNAIGKALELQCQASSGTQLCRAEVYFILIMTVS